MENSHVQKILVPTDFSANSKEAFEYALSIAKNFGASVDVLHVWERIQYVTSEATLYVVTTHQPQEIYDYIKEQAVEDMKGFLKIAESASFEGELNSHLEEGNVSETIVRYAKENEIDMIVMGTHGRSGVAHLFMGSVAEKVIRYATCPVLTYRPKPEVSNPK